MFKENQTVHSVFVLPVNLSVSVLHLPIGVDHVKPPRKVASSAFPEADTTCLISIFKPILGVSTYHINKKEIFNYEVLYKLRCGSPRHLKILQQLRCGSGKRSERGTRVSTAPISVLGKTGVSGVLSIVLGTIVIISGFLLSRRDVTNSIVPAVIGLIAGIGIMLIGRLVFVKKNKAKGALNSASWSCRCGRTNNQADISCRACGMSRFWICEGCGTHNENTNTYCTACQKYHG